MPAESRSGESRPTDLNPAVDDLRLGLFVVALSVLLTAIMLLLRTGLPTPALPLIAGPAILAVAVLPPLLLKPGIWIGPLCVLGLLLGCLICSLGVIGIALLGVVAVACVVVAIRRVVQARGRRMPGWIGILVAAALLCTLLIDGNKYLNFVADQLLLWGRTDGDIMFHGAIANAYRYFHFPSTGIDGLNWLRYHTGVDAVASLIATGSHADAVFALLVLRAQVLFPLIVFALAWGALTLGRVLLPNYRLSAMAALLGASFVILLLQAGTTIVGISLENDPLLLSTVILMLLAPSVFIELTARGDQAKAAMAVAALAVFVLGIAKISTGAIWCAFVGYLILRTVGPRRIAFWIAGGAIVLLFGLSYYIASDPAETGAVWFGKPFFVEYGFAKGNYLFPLRLQLMPLVAVLGLWWLGRSAEARPRRMLIECVVAAALAANVVGVALQIPSADGVFFFLAVNALAMLPLAALIAAAPFFIGRLAPRYRRFAAAIGVLLVIAAGVDAGLQVDNGFQQAISATALLKTGDLGYYADDKRKAWRADAARAMREVGLLELFLREAPTPRGVGLRDALAAAKQADAGTAVYIRPQSDFWSLVPDCDGRSLWTMAAAGVPMIDGYVPVQADCAQEFAISGYGKPPAVRTDFTDAQVCERAGAKGITEVLVVEALADRSRDRRLACH